MKNEDNSIFEIDRWLKWLQRAAYVGIGVFAVILIAYAIKFRAFNDGVKAISNLPNDWSAFGSLLSGSSSLLGAVGTVGVMLLGIKQFKIQQQQIKEQKDRQDKLERKQSEIWRLESNLLEQQIKKIDFENFKNNLKSIEEFSSNKYEFNNINYLYNNLNTKEKKQYINDYLIEVLNSFNEKTKNDENSTITATVKIDELKWLFKNLSSVLNFSYTSSPITGDILYHDDNIGINIIKTECSINHLNDLLLALQVNLCLENPLPSISTNFIINENDIRNVINENVHHSEFTIHGTFKGYEALLKFYLEVMNSPLKCNIKELFSLNVSMNGIEEFKNNNYGKEFIKNTRFIIDKININDPLSRTLNQLINDFNSKY